MTEYRIFESAGFQADLASRLGPRFHKIVARLHSDVYPQLRQQPFFGRNIRKLRAYKPATWRYRIGDYRFFYTIDDERKIVFMIAADTRQKAYR